MKSAKILIISAILPCAASMAHAALTFSGNALPAVAITPVAASGMTGVYVVDTMHGLRATYGGSTATARWYKFSDLGAAYAEEIATVDRDGNNSTVDIDPDARGYIVEDGDRRQYYWIEPFAPYSFSAIAPAADNVDCDRIALAVDGDAPRMIYRHINGTATYTIDREIPLTYSTLVYDEGSMQYIQTTADDKLEYIENHTLRCDAPLCDTRFNIGPDRFMQTWGIDFQAESASVTATAVQCATTAEQTSREVPNEQKEDAALGGSGPCDISFHAAVTDAAIYREWQFARDAEFDLIDYRFNDLDVDFTFRDHGTTYVRFVANNAAGTCEYAGPTYEIFIGESRLECPNAFSPQASPGINDEWRVSYKSIVDFQCDIFNRQGRRIFSFSDPSQGWDGKYGGKYVPAGTYYYVIRAHGTDGRDYKLSGDINIINYHSSGSATSSPESGDDE